MQVCTHSALRGYSPGTLSRAGQPPVTAVSSESPGWGPKAGAFSLTAGPPGSILPFSFLCLFFSSEEDREASGGSGPGAPPFTKFWGVGTCPQLPWRGPRAAWRTMPYPHPVEGVHSRRIRLTRPGVGGVCVDVWPAAHRAERPSTSDPNTEGPHP